MSGEAMSVDVLIFTGRDRGLHISDEAEGFFPNLRVGFDGGSAGTEFFDTYGYRLLPEFNEEWQAVDLLRAGGQPKPRRVLRRLRSVVGLMTDHVRQNAVALQEVGLSPEQALQQIPQLKGMELDEAVEACRRAFGHPKEQPDVRDPWHNFWSHGILS